MDKDIIIVMKDGTQAKLTPMNLKFIDELKEFFAERNITEDEIPRYLAKLACRE